MIKVAFTVFALRVGGIERVTTTIANALATDGDYNVTLINLNNQKEHFKVDVQTYRRPGKCEYNWRRVMGRLSRLIGTGIGLPWQSWVEQLFSKDSYDYIVLNPDYFIYFDIIKELQPNSKIYLWMHNNYDIYLEKYFKVNKDALLHAAHEADGIICIEAYSAAKWREWNNHVVLIHNPLTLQDNGEITNLESPVIAGVSRIVKEHKGLDYMIEVAASLPGNWRIELAGDGPDRNWMQEEIDRRGLSKKLLLMGALGDKGLREHYAHASIFLSTSRWEGFPLVAAEAMSYGLPFVAFDIPAMREVTDNGKYGLLAPLGDVDAITKILDVMAGSYSYRKKYSLLSLERVKEFQLESILQQWKSAVFD